MIWSQPISGLYRTKIAIGLCDVGEFENLPPGTAAQLKNKCTNKVQKIIEKLLPEPQPNSEPILMGIASAPILQNPMLAAFVFRQSFKNSYSYIFDFILSEIKFRFSLKSAINSVYFSSVLFDFIIPLSLRP